MQRLQFLADVGHLAPDGDEVARLRELPEKAARAVPDVALAPLLKWVASRGWRLVDAAFPRARFEAIRTAAYESSSRRSTGAAERGSTWGKRRAKDR